MKRLKDIFIPGTKMSLWVSGIVTVLMALVLFVFAFMEEWSFYYGAVYGVIFAGPYLFFCENLDVLKSRKTDTAE